MQKKIAVPGCNVVDEHTFTCVFASFDTICAASDVSIDEPADDTASSSFLLCMQHYHTVYKHCNPESVLECALCGCKRRHHVGSKLPWKFRHVAQPESIHILLQDMGNLDGCLTTDSLACSKCYLLPRAGAIGSVCLSVQSKMGLSRDLQG